VVRKTCDISSCRRYRWSLYLEIYDCSREIIFVGLNPSLSDDQYTDNTTKKIINIAKNNNYGKIKIINLFGLISSSPKNLISHFDPIGNKNNHVINKSLKYWSKNIDCNLWIAWGNNGKYLNRNQYFLKTLKPYIRSKKILFDKIRGPLHIKKTKTLNPIHPLYCSNNSKLTEYFLDHRF